MTRSINPFQRLFSVVLAVVLAVVLVVALTAVLISTEAVGSNNAPFSPLTENPCALQRAQLAQTHLQGIIGNPPYRQAWGTTPSGEWLQLREGMRVGQGAWQVIQITVNSVEFAPTATTKCETTSTIIVTLNSLRTDGGRAGNGSADHDRADSRDKQSTNRSSQ